MSRASKAQAALRQQKDARQKKLLIALAPVLLGLLAWQGPGILKAFSGTPPPPPPVAAPAATTPGTPAATDPAAAAGAPSTAAPGATPVASSGPLPNTDEPVPPGEGELVSFDRFVGKDPFRQQVEAKESADGGSGGSGGGADDGKDDGDGGGDGDGDDSGTDDPPLTTPPDDDDGDGGSDGDADLVATIDVNGTVQVVTADGTFPSNEPIFRLVSLSRKSAKIGLVAGAFSTQSQTITLRIGKPLTLISQPDGLRYRITLRRVG